jgi:hypothetical protein
MHSDGQFSLNELLDRAESLGLEVVALTDHNTGAGLAELDSAGFHAVLPVIRGIEWTTYFGHVVIIGSDHYVDWRDVLPDNIDAKLKLVRQANGVVGVAHPYAAGDPVCCGCHWEFKLQDWRLADYIEIWSGSNPQLLEHNRKALHKWNALLDDDLYLTAVSARDWHGGEDDTRPFGVTYLLLDESMDITIAAKDALRNHRAYVTVGPTVTLSADCAGQTAGIGGTLPSGPCTFKISVGIGQRQHIWRKFNVEPLKIVLIGEGGREQAHVAFPGYDVETVLTIPNARAWIRAEVHGSMNAKECALVVTNPLVFK